MEVSILMRTVDVAVVGAGPAGMSAGLTAARRGLSVMLIDEDDAVGGHLRWSLSREPGFPGELKDRRGFEIADWVNNQLRTSGVEIVRGVAWGLFDGPVLGVATASSSFQVQAHSVILATGSTDITFPFPGWELPGVMTARAARRLVNLHRVLPGRRIVVVGDGSDARATIDELRMAGAEIVSSQPSTAGIEVGGSGSVEWVSISDRRVTVDCAIIAFGRQPDPGLAIQAGCDVAFSDINGAWVPRRSKTTETSAPAVFVVGDAAGICTAAESFAEGAVAGEAASGGEGLADALGHLDALRTDARRRELQELFPAVGAR